MNTPKINNSEFLSYFTFISILIAIFSISPLLTAILIPFLLMIASDYISNSLRKLLSILGFLSIAIVQSSWVLTLVADIGVYYNNYNSLLNGEFEYIFEFGGGVEVILPLYFLLLGLIFGDISPVQIVLAVDIPVVIIISIFLNSLVNKFPTKNRALIIGACLVVFFSTSWASLLLRQYFSLMFFLLALMYRSKTFALISIFTHLSALLFFILLKVYSINRNLFRLLIIVFSLATYFITDISDYIINTISSPIIAQKFYFYLDEDHFSTTGNLPALYVMIVAVLYLFSMFIIEKCFSKQKHHSWNNLRLDIYLILIGVIMTINIPLLPGRIFLIPILFSPLLVYLSYSYNNSFIMKTLYSSYYLIFLIRNLTPTLTSAPVNTNSYWQAFDWYGTFPFYYIF